LSGILLASNSLYRKEIVKNKYPSLFFDNVGDEEKKVYGIQFRMVTEGENSPIRHYQTVWGMKDVDLKFNPEALEIIANQVLNFNTEFFDLFCFSISGVLHSGNERGL